MTTRTKPAKRPAKRPAKIARRANTADNELKPFPVVRGKYLFWFSPEDVGFSVTCQNLAGVNAQGDTFEDALAHAASMAAFVEECQSDPLLKQPAKPGKRKTEKAADE